MKLISKLIGYSGMVSIVRLTDQDKIRRLKPFDEFRYHTINLDHLVMYAVGQVEKLHADISFENVVAATFALFPKKFSLLGFPEYPDSNRIGKCLWRFTSKARQWLGGKSRHGFFVTDRSRQIVAQTESLLSGLSVRKTGATSQTRRKESILAEVSSSPAYHKFCDGKLDSISEADFCYVLQGTLDTSKDTLKENLATLIKFAEELRHSEVLRFAKWLEERFVHFMFKAVSQEEYHGKRRYPG